jgi:hypothetical protein
VYQYIFNIELYLSVILSDPFITPCEKDDIKDYDYNGKSEVIKLYNMNKKNQESAWNNRRT